MFILPLRAQHAHYDENGEMSDGQTHSKLDAPSRLLLDREQVAVWLNVEPNTVDYLHRVKRLRAFQIGKSLRWRPKDVVAFVNGLEKD